MTGTICIYHISLCRNKNNKKKNKRLKKEEAMNNYFHELVERKWKACLFRFNSDFSWLLIQKASRKV